MNNYRKKIFKICEEIFADRTESKYLWSDKHTIAIRNRDENVAYYDLKVRCNSLKVYKTQHLIDGKGINGFITSVYVLTGEIEMPKYETKRTLLLSGYTNNLKGFFTELAKLAPELLIQFKEE